MCWKHSGTCSSCGHMPAQEISTFAFYKSRPHACHSGLPEPVAWWNDDLRAASGSSFSMALHSTLLRTDLRARRATGRAPPAQRHPARGWSARAPSQRRPASPQAVGDHGFLPPQPPHPWRRPRPDLRPAARYRGSFGPGSTAGARARELGHARSSAPMRLASPLIASAIGSGRWIQSASGPSGRRPSTRTGWPGVADHGRVGRHVVDDHAVGADLRAVADRDRPEQLGARADRDVVLDGRVALAGREAGAAERHALVERDVVADLGRLADHHAHAVVDEEARRRSRAAGWISMPVSVRDAVASARGASGMPPSCRRVGDAVGEQRVHARPRGEDLQRPDAARRRIALARRRRRAGSRRPRGPACRVRAWCKGYGPPASAGRYGAKNGVDT